MKTYELTTRITLEASSKIDAIMVVDQILADMKHRIGMVNELKPTEYENVIIEGRG